MFRFKNPFLMSNWAVEIPHPAGRICCYKNPTHNPHIIADRGPSGGSATRCRKTNSVAGGTCWWQQWYHWCILYIDVISHKHYFGSSLVFANEDCRQHVDKRLCNACENWKPSRPGWCIPKMIALFLKDFLLGFGVRLSWFELNCEKLWKNHAIQSHHFFHFSFDNM